MKFTLEEYFPAVHKGPTRVGKVTDLVLLEAEPEGRTMGCDSFGTWVARVYATVRLVDDEKVAWKFRGFKDDVKRIGSHGKLLLGPRMTWTKPYDGELPRKSEFKGQR